VTDKAVQAVQSAGFIQDFEECFVDFKTAKNEIKRNTKSNQTHQVGAAAQQLFEQADAIKRNGVAKQCTIHVKLAIAPIKSDFCFITDIINYILFPTTPFELEATPTWTWIVSTYFFI